VRAALSASGAAGHLGPSDGSSVNVLANGSSAFEAVTLAEFAPIPKRDLLDEEATALAGRQPDAILVGDFVVVLAVDLLPAKDAGSDRRNVLEPFGGGVR
jgi:hypothetical protein